MAFRPSEDGVEHGLTPAEQRHERLKAFHRDLRGHRRAPWWPNVPKTQADLAVCEGPLAHEWQPPHRVALTGRGYALEVTVCGKCPVALTDVVLV